MAHLRGKRLLEVYRVEPRVPEFTEFVGDSDLYAPYSYYRREPVGEAERGVDFSTVSSHFISS